MQMSYGEIPFFEDMRIVCNLKIKDKIYDKFLCSNRLSFSDRLFVLDLDFCEVISAFGVDEGLYLIGKLHKRAFPINIILKWFIDENNLLDDERDLIETLIKLLDLRLRNQNDIRSFLRVSKVNQVNNNFKCSYIGCGDNAIECHNVPESWLKKIAFKNSSRFDVIQNKCVKLQDREHFNLDMSISHAGIDYIYCGKHDTVLFSKLENNNWSVLNEDLVKQCMCKSYNSLLFGLKNTQDNYNKILDIIKSISNNKDVVNNIDIIDFDFFSLLEHLDMKLNKISTDLKFDIDFEYMEEKTNKKDIDIASNCCIPYKDTFGKINFIFCGIIPKENKLIYWVANIRDDLDIPLRVHNFKGIPKDLLKNLVLDLSFMSKQTFINPNSKCKYSNLFMDIDLEFDRIYKAEEVYKKLMNVEFTDKDGIIRTFKYYFVPCKNTDFWNLNKE